MQVCDWATANGIDPAPFERHRVDGQTLIELEVPEIVQLGAAASPLALRDILAKLKRCNLPNLPHAC